MKLFISENKQQQKQIPDEHKIILKDIKIFKNKHGQWCLTFDTENHKYLGIAYNISSGSLWSVDENGEQLVEMTPFVNRGFQIITDDDYESVTYDWKTIYLVPESKEEEQELWGVAAILPTKWSYACTIVGMDDFYEQRA